MKLAIVTRSDETIKKVTDITHKAIKYYADKWGADFITLDYVDPPVITDDNHPHWRIIEVYNLYEKYDRILVLDSDIVMTKECPNLFEIVNYDKIGTIFEDKGSRAPYRKKSIMAIQKKYGNIEWRDGYINTGVFLTSKIHKDIFKPIKGEYYTAYGSDDVHIGYNINKLGFKIKELSFKFNHMTMFSEDWNNRANRFDSYIIHYAGQGKFNKRLSRFDNIKEDYNKVWNT